MASRLPPNFGGWVGDKAGDIAARGVPHLKVALGFVVIDVVHLIVRALPRPIDGQDGVVGRLSRRIQQPAGVQEAFDQVVVNEELAGGANVN